MSGGRLVRTHSSVLSPRSGRGAGLEDLAERGAAMSRQRVSRTRLARRITRRVRFIGNEKPERWAGAVAEHEEMIVALAARDAPRLAEVLGRHLDHTMDRVRDAI